MMENLERLSGKLSERSNDPVHRVPNRTRRGAVCALRGDLYQWAGGEMRTFICWAILDLGSTWEKSLPTPVSLSHGHAIGTFLLAGLILAGWQDLKEIFGK